MSETGASDDLPFREAVKEIARATRFEEPLRQRTEGLTWMILAITNAGIVVSSGLLSILFGWPAWVVLVFGAWIAAGVVTAALLWRSASLAAPSLARYRGDGVVVIAALVVALVIAWVVPMFYVPAVNEPTFYLLWIGTAWVVLALLNIRTCSRRGGRVAVTVGALIALTAAVLAILPLDPFSDAGYAVSIAVGALAAVAYPFLGGLWQATRE